MRVVLDDRPSESDHACREKPDTVNMDGKRKPEPHKPQAALSSRQGLGKRIESRMSGILGGRTVSMLVIAAAIGVAGGYGAILFRYLIEWANKVAFPDGISLSAISAAPWYWVVLAPAAGGLVVGPLVYFLAREAKGHGVPEVIDACKNQGGKIRPRVAAVKILASAVSIGSGGSVGREGPIVQIGSAVGSSMGQFFGLKGEDLINLVACGAAAGIAATFNAPIAGVLFSIEIILGKGNVRIFSPLVVAAVIATVITRFHLGNSPAFAVAPYALVSAWELPLYILLGALAAAVGVAFTRGLYWLEDLWELVPLPPYSRAVFGGAIVGFVALWMPQIMGVGYETIEQILHWESGQINLKSFSGLGILMVLIVVKIFATGTTIGSGGSGGIFAPSLFMGACLGGVFGGLANAVLPHDIIASPSAYALVAMGALVAATTHAPLTAILIVFELTDRHTIILPLMLSCIIATIIAQRLNRESIYTLKLVRRGSLGTGGTEAEVMTNTLVEPLMHPVRSSLDPKTPLREIVELVLHGERQQQYVTDEKGRLIGVVTSEDVAGIVRDEDSLEQLLVAADMMHPPSGSVFPDNTLDRCMSLLSQHRVDELPVVEKTSGILVGWIRQADIIDFYNREILQRDAIVKFVEGPKPSSSGEEAVHLESGEVKDEIKIGSGLAGKSLRELDLRARFHVVVYAVRHRGAAATFPDPSRPLTRGDVLVVVGPSEQVAKVRGLN